jgi:hypothetical protein
VDDAMVAALDLAARDDKGRAVNFRVRHAFVSVGQRVSLS